MSGVTPITPLPIRPNPTNAQMAAGSMSYYTVRPESDTARLTVTLTKTAGEGDMYMTRKNESTVIDVLDQTTYRYYI